MRATTQFARVAVLFWSILFIASVSGQILEAGHRGGSDCAHCKLGLSGKRRDDTVACIDAVPTGDSDHLGDLVLALFEPFGWTLAEHLLPLVQASVNLTEVNQARALSPSAPRAPPC